MNDLKRVFLMKKDKFPLLGDVIIMSMSVEGMNYPKEVIRRAFNNCVSKDEYEQSEKNEIINALFSYSIK